MLFFSILCLDSTPKFCDFGLSRVLRGHAEVILDAGSFPYQAPEKTLSRAADIYALGISVLETMALNKWRHWNKAEVEKLLVDMVRFLPLITGL